MILFKKKYNIDQDRLIRKFDIDKRCYYYVLYYKSDYCVINYDDLDRKSKKQLLMENKQLAIDDNLYMEEIENLMIRKI